MSGSQISGGPGARLARAGRLGALAFLASLVSLVAMEAVLRLVPLPVGAGAVSRRFTQNLPGLASEVVYERNEFGFRSLSMQSKEKPADTLRVLCIGASTTDQATQSTEDTWCALVERELREPLRAAGVTLETAGHGRPGLRAWQLLALARGGLLDFEPDLVVTLMGINDLAWNGGPGYRYHDLETARAPFELAGEGLFAGCRPALQLCRRLDRVEGSLRHLMRLLSGRAVEWHCQELPALRERYRGYPAVETPVRDPDPIVEFDGAMEALLAHLAAAGVDAVVLGQPVLWSADMEAEEEQALWFEVRTPEGPVRPPGAWLAREMARYNERQAASARRLGMAYVDLDRMIPKDLDHFFDDCHYTDRGSARVAQAIAPVIRERLEARLRARPEGGAPPPREDR